MKEQEGGREEEGRRRLEERKQGGAEFLTRLFGFVSQQFVIRSEGG